MTTKKPKPRMYEPFWQKLKQSGIIKVELTNSTDPKIQRKLANTLRKALQKEKYLDTNFRVIYSDAVLKTTMDATGKYLVIELDKGFSCTSTEVVTDLFKNMKKDS